jgi:deoxyribodipyrimidine photo-lyase
MKEQTLIWFKADLRLRDHEPLFRAVEKGSVLPVFILDERLFRNHPLGFRKAGTFRMAFLLAAIRDLRSHLQKAGSNLVFRMGLPEVILPALSKQHHCTRLFTAHEVADEEIRIQQKVKTGLTALGIGFSAFENSSLLEERDLPWPADQVPDVFTTFRKGVEQNLNIRPAFLSPEKIQTSFDGDWGEFPTLSTLGYDEIQYDHRSAFPFSGGETEAWKRLTEYFWDKDLLRNYKETRNGLIGIDYSTKLSAALSHGCISARLMYEEIQRYERERIKNQSTYGLVFELLWREYFRAVARKYGTKIFMAKGIRQESKQWRQDRESFEQWRLGQTGNDFIDANMRELLLTGFMSNRGRQNVASYLTKDLGIDWRWGAAWFESQLIDYDVHSNWLNWAYVAGVGNDPRVDRYFNTESQVRKYDPERVYQKWWLNKKGGFSGEDFGHHEN